MGEQERSQKKRDMNRIRWLETFLGKLALTGHTVNFGLLDFINMGVGRNTLSTSEFLYYTLLWSHKIVSVILSHFIYLVYLNAKMHILVNLEDGSIGGEIGLKGILLRFLKGS